MRSAHCVSIAAMFCDKTTGRVRPELRMRRLESRLYTWAWIELYGIEPSTFFAAECFDRIVDSDSPEVVLDVDWLRSSGPLAIR